MHPSSGRTCTFVAPAGTRCALAATRKTKAIPEVNDELLTATAIDFLVELWNATGAPQLWTGTEDLVDKLERNEQWASRLEFTFSLELDASEESTADVRGLVRHQIKSRLPELNGEGERLTRLCEKLARAGNFRRVEMRLATMLYLSERPKNKNAGWCDLFEQAGEWLKEDL